MNAFERYAPFIQEEIYRAGWQSLRGVQNAAAQAIFESEDNVLLTASTASGKTEAAFFPILTLLEEDPPSSVGVLYIAPLKPSSTTSLSGWGRCAGRRGSPSPAGTGTRPRARSGSC